MAGANEDRATARADRALPHNLDAEEGLLAACIIDGGQDTLNSCLEARLEPESFFKPAHQVIFQLLVDCYRSGTLVDEVVLIDRLQSRTVETIDWLRQRQKLTPPKTSLLELIGGPQVITGLTSRIETTGHARYWLEIVREKWLLRRLIATSSQIVEDAYTNQDSLDAFIDSVEQQILRINADRVTDSAEKFDSAVDKATHLISRILQGTPDEGVMTGYTDVDAMTFGLHGGQMIVLAARPSMGKTSFGMNIVENAALPRRGKPVPTLVFSLEMPSDQLAMRMLCGRARVNMKRVRDRMISREQMKTLANVAKELKQAPIWIDDSSSVNILELRAKARRMHQQNKIGLIVIDYLQLISGTDSRVPREQQISEISRGIKAMAKEMNLPVLVLSQLNRAAEKENRQPRISDLRESGAIEQDADVVFLLASRQNKEDNPGIPQAARERDLIIAKQRNGPTGEVPLTFIPDFTRFENYTRQQPE